MPLLSVPPIADPRSYSGRILVSSNIVHINLSEELMFLQEVLLEYEETNPDWRYSVPEVRMMVDVRDKLTTAESTLTPPSFTEQESLWLQEILLEYEETHADWRRRLSDFNVMLTIRGIIEGEVPNSPISTGTLVSPPTYLCNTITIPKPCNIEQAGFVGTASFNTPQSGPQQTAIWPVGAPGAPGPAGPRGEQGLTGSNFTFIQSIPSDVWVIAHNLNAYPVVVVIDSSGTQVIGGVNYDSLNQITITFSGGFSGTASLVS